MNRKNLQHITFKEDFQTADCGSQLFTIGSRVTFNPDLLEGINTNNSNNGWTVKIIEKQ